VPSGVGGRTDYVALIGRIPIFGILGCRLKELLSLQGLI
jgi:hypothetical protein